MTAPTSVKGFVDPYTLGTDFGSLYVDLLEHVPDLTWPLSVPVYAKMRRDPQLTAILQGWTLQLRRAQWQIDPAGCRPEVVSAVADGLGLAVAGADKPGAARLCGVSWSEHLQAALRALTFGHAAFEMQADVSSGKALLSGLWERPQWTISHIHVDGKTGLLEGITQDAATNLVSPQIKADRLVWYVADREGANWAGTSLLRPAYAAWLIKEEMRRVHAIANRRWGMGVPVMEALPGTNPTSGQMTEAMQLAAAARSGEQAGAATPPGFTLKIQGLSGSVPDTLSFMRWLDQQMSRAALMGMLDLGETPNGSRALGETFVDAFLLALEATAEAVADTATRQAAARIVDWNWGADEPVPRIVVSGVGSRREVTAEALQMLLASGGLASDPGLEAWIRREWRLPEREGMAQPKPTAPGVDLPDKDEKPPAEPEQEVAAAAKPRPRSRRRTQQPSLFDDDDGESDAARIQQQWDQAKARLLRRWPKLAAPLVGELADQAQAAVEVGDLGLLGQLQASAGVVAALAVPLRKSGTDLAAEAAAGVVAEAAAQDTVIDVPAEPGADRVQQHADAVARIIAAGYASGAARTSLQLAGAAPQEVRNEVERHLTELGTSVNGLVGDNIGSLLSAAQFAGRLAVLEENPATAYRANETPDRNTCDPCKAINGTEFQTLRAALAAYPLSGQHAACEGRSRCRGFIVPIF
ncbi:phage portal protein family protein [Actinoplanes campanulatus]|uniref:phage portal protein family protein n=1 Tax=Actinoplanes campanulatus TaxID=113559 RepID=UPI0019430C7D|nr:DUF935 family protein [Actinoplanes campanulatus]GID40149.1 hypothetical protein Aca09nite_66550 [Actinoplanes campanulatus]